jgi:hypothetical protein
MLYRDSPIIYVVLYVDAATMLGCTIYEVLRLSPCALESATCSADRIEVQQLKVMREPNTGHHNMDTSSDTDRSEIDAPNQTVPQKIPTLEPPQKMVFI